MSPARGWWQDGIIYQVYPRSFQDSNGDGVGDLSGVLRRLDYLASLGVEAIWLSPIFPSPMKDFGYDVADYTNIHPLFGTLDDFHALLAAVHARGMKLILDLVPNHTSDQHAWFRASRSSRDNPKRDWYIWRDPKPGPDGSPQPPNNWLSFFGGPAWTFDEATGQFYLHQFLPEQPELNYRNPAVLDAMLGEMRTWLERGVDGFRVDVIWLMIKDEALRDNPPNPLWQPGMDPHHSQHQQYTADQPEVHEIVRAMRRLLDEYGHTGRERVLIGEIYLPNDRLMTYYGTVDAAHPDPAHGDECHLPFNFQLIDAPWDAATVRRMVDQYEADLPPHGWPNWVLGNHDKRRLATRVGDAQARVATLLLLTLRGTPTCYYGDEIGMRNVPIPPERIQDTPALARPELAEILGRDPVRTPMQWDASPNAGFCPPGVLPWLPLADDFARHNVEAQTNDPTSLLSLFRAVTALRRRTPALAAGAYRSLDSHADLFVYTRTLEDEAVLVALNFGRDAHRIDLSAPLAAYEPAATVLLDSLLQRTGTQISLAALDLAPDEGLLITLRRRRP